MISIITPTNRIERLDIVNKAIKNQNIEFEWLICSKEDPKIENAKWIKDDFVGGFWTLNRAYNRLISESKGDIIVSWQDNIWTPPDGVRKFKIAVESTGGVVSGVGDQYERFGYKPEVKVWSDPRKTNKYGTFYECIWNDAEFNWAAFPKEIAYKVGGFDEGLDFLGYGGDQLSFCERLAQAGIKFYLDQCNESYTIRHGRRKDWNTNHTLFAEAEEGVSVYDKRKMELIKKGEWQCLHYLKK